MPWESPGPLAGFFDLTGKAEVSDMYATHTHSPAKCTDPLDVNIACYALSVLRTLDEIKTVNSLQLGSDPVAGATAFLQVIHSCQDDGQHGECIWSSRKALLRCRLPSALKCSPAIQVGSGTALIPDAR